MARFAPVLPAAMLLPVALLSACHQRDEKDARANAAAAAFTPPPMQRPTPIAGQANVVPLTGYIGHYPRDAVNGVSFFDRSEVANALVAAVGDPKLRRMVVGRDGVTVPIFAHDGRIAAHGCEPHNCAAHNWTFLVTPNGASATLCLHDAAVMGDRSRWYDNDAPVLRAGNCPQA